MAQLLDQDEWFDIARTFKPELTREEFNEQWAEFLRLKEEYRKKAAIH